MSGEDALDVCILTTGFPRFRGDKFGTFVLALGRALVRDGLRVEVVAPHDTGAALFEEMDGVSVRRFRYARRPRLAYGDGIPTNLARRRRVLLQVPGFLLAFWWAALRCSRHCSVVHAQWSISGLVGYWAARWWRRPVVLTVRGSDVHVMHRGVLATLNRHTWRRADRVLAVSADIARVLADRGVAPGKVRVVHNGVDEAFRPSDRLLSRARLDLPSGAVIALFVGFLAPVKGLDVLLQALARVRAPMLCVIIGDGDLATDLRTQAASLNLEETVRFVGVQSHEIIPAWMVSADFLVLPSRSEGRPNVVLEAQACGLPVVATRVGGTPELVHDGEDGLLVEADDVAGLATAIERLATSAEERIRFGERARARIETDGYTWQASARMVRQVYAEVLEAA